MSYGVESWGGGPEDVDPPQITNVIPSPGSTISAGDRIRFDVTDDSGEFTRIMITVTFPTTTRTTEVVHDGTSFTAFYAAGSLRTTIPSGFRYSVGRAGGWLGPPTFRAYAIDRSGLEV